MSNLAWGAEHHGEALALLARLRVEGIEVAPTKISPWKDLTPQRLRDYRSEIEAAGLKISSLQAIFYGVEGAELFGDSNAFQIMTDHMARVADVGATLGADVVVYGAPKTRLRGEMPLDQARALAAERFAELGDIVEPFGMTIAIEPVPSAYGGDFMTSAYDVIELVREVRHPFVRLHLDTGCVLLAGDAIEDAIREGIAWLSHFHIAEPQLGNFSVPRAKHEQAATALRQCGYAKWMAIEMQAQPIATIEALSTAIEYVKNTYETH